jgi:uncharacterized membrane protein YfcA
MLKDVPPSLEPYIKGFLLTLPPMILGYMFPHHVHVAFIAGILLSGFIGWRWAPERRRAKALFLIIAIVVAASIISFQFK